MAKGKKTGGRDFEKGHGGRPKGAENKVTREARELALSIVQDAVYLANLKVRIEAGKAPQMEPLLWQYAYGKPKELLEHSGNDAEQIRIFCKLPMGEKDLPGSLTATAGRLLEDHTNHL